MVSSANSVSAYLYEKYSVLHFSDWTKVTEHCFIFEATVVCWCFNQSLLSRYVFTKTKKKGSKKVCTKLKIVPGTP